MMWRNPWDGSNVEIPGNGVDYIVFEYNGETYVLDGRSKEAIIKGANSADVVQSLINMLEDTYFNTHSGKSIGFVGGKYTFNHEVIITKLPFRFVGLNTIGGSNYQVGATIEIDYDNWKGGDYQYDVDKDGNDETIYPAFIVRYDPDTGIKYANGTSFSLIRFSSIAPSSKSTQPVGVFSNIVSNIVVEKCSAFGSGLVFLRGARQEGLTQEEQDLGLTGTGSYYNKIIFNNLNGGNKNLVGISTFNGANETLVLGNSDVSNYNIGLLADGGGIRVVGNSFESNEVGISVQYHDIFIINNRYEGNTYDIDLNSYDNYIIETSVSKFLNKNLGNVLVSHSIDDWYISPYNTTSGGYSFNIIFDEYARLNKILRTSGKLIIDRSDTNKYLRVEGSATLSGDGSTTTISIPLTMQQDPSVVIVVPNSKDASGFEYAYYDSTTSSIKVVYTTAPPSGTDNLKYSYIVIV